MKFQALIRLPNHRYSMHTLRVHTKSRQLCSSLRQLAPHIYGSGIWGCMEPVGTGCLAILFSFSAIDIHATSLRFALIHSPETLKFCVTHPFTDPVATHHFNSRTLLSRKRMNRAGLPDVVCPHGRYATFSVVVVLVRKIKRLLPKNIT